MKIAYILNEYPSLTETFIAREIEALRDEGLEVDIWALQAGDGAHKLPASLVSRRVAQWGGNLEAYWRETGRRWAKKGAKELQDVTHVHAGWASFPSEIAWGASEILRVPWSFSGHARDIWVEGGNLGGKLEAARFTAVCTQAGARHLRDVKPSSAHKIHYIPHGITPSSFVFRPGRHLHAPIQLLAVGRLTPKKGFPLLPLVISELMVRGHDVHAILIGEGPQRAEIEDAIKNMKDPQLTLAGAFTHEHVVEAMHQSDLFVMPTCIAPDGDRDGLPNVLLEAAACGLPIVSTRAGAVEDFLDDSCAWLCEPDCTSIASSIEDALTNYEISLQRAAAARQRVEERYDSRNNVKALVKAFTA